MEANDINQSVGVRLHRLRTEKQLTLEALSELTGVSVSMLSAIERGRKSPTLTILNKVKTGLGISMSELLDDEPERGIDRKLFRREEMRKIHSRKGFELWVMLDYMPDNAVEVMRQELAPHSGWESVTHGRDLWEYCIVVQGELTIYVGGETCRVREGDVFSFKADVQHSYRNNGDVQLKMIVINCYR